MFALKNRDTPEPSEAKCNTRFHHSKQLLKTLYSDISVILFLDDQTFSVAMPKQLKSY